ncbi:MAG: transglutaminase domain-containing protein [Planctomycetes bacterium]|nr:transglutaminase domain-containing protein [Planctomycetota bacterium]NUQ34045.1 transglutaminase domain-containing protein [Planctomycetaceae bacterium]
MRIYLALCLAIIGILIASCSAQGAAYDHVIGPDGVRDDHVFNVRHDVKISVPKGAKSIDAWIPKPIAGEFGQGADSFRIECAHATDDVKDDNGNAFIHLRVDDPTEESITVSLHYQLTRREVTTGAVQGLTRPLDDFEKLDHARWLAPSGHSPLTDRLRGGAHAITAAERNPVKAANAIYHWVVTNAKHSMKRPAMLKASGRGDANHAFDHLCGDTNDIAALYAGLLRASGIPTREVYGVLVKDGRAAFHTWVEFFAPEVGWIPADPVLANLHNGGADPEACERIARYNPDGNDGTRADYKSVTYYFGNLDSRRIALCRGRDLKLGGETVNCIASGAHIVIDGAAREDDKLWTGELTLQ